MKKFSRLVMAGLRKIIDFDARSGFEQTIREQAANAALEGAEMPAAKGSTFLRSDS
jgi:hypothetical protein